MYIYNYVNIWRAARNVKNPPANNCVVVRRTALQQLYVDLGPVIWFQIQMKSLWDTLIPETHSLQSTQKHSG